MGKIVVIGANHAGTAAVNTILATQPGSDVAVYDQNSNISFLGCGMALWIGKQINSGDGLFYSDKQKLEAAGAKVTMEASVDNIDFDNKKIDITLKDGSKITDTYDKLILATGSLPIVPSIPGAQLENVQLVKLYQNAQEVIEKLKSPNIKNVVVVGAGYIGVELAEAFQRQNKSVTMVEVAGTCLTGYYDEPFTSKMCEVLSKNGINLRYGEKVVEIKGENGKVCGVVTDKGNYAADMVVLCVGFHPNNALGKDKLTLFKNGAYLVDDHQRTSIPDVYAIGDCATVHDNAIDAPNYIALATNAVRSGLVAAHNVCGIDLATPGTQGSNGICVFNYKMASTGLTYAKAKSLGIDAAVSDFEDNQLPEFMESGNNKVNIRIVYNKTTRAVLGAQIASEHDISMALHMFSLAIQEKVSVDRLKLLDIFFLPHFNKPYNYLTMAALGAK